MTKFTTVAANQLDHIHLDQGIILDVRTPAEHAEKHLASAHAHMPLDELNPTDFMARHRLDKDTKVYILCRSGKRAVLAAEKFVADGFQNIHVIEGGIIACEDCGQKVEGCAVPSDDGSLKI